MTMDEPPLRYKFDEFELDMPKRRLLRGGAVVPLNPKAFDLLAVLIRHNGELLTKDDLFRLVWDEHIVEESNLTVNMSAIRRALGERASAPKYITTVSGRGYYFTANLNEAENRLEISEPEENLFVETRSFSRITVEREIDDSEQSNESGEILAADALPSAPESFFKRNRTAISAGLILGLLIVAGIGVYLRRDENTAKNSAAFQTISMKRLTNLGNVNNAALSPDGKLFAYSVQEKDGRQSLWLGHIDGGGESIQLRPSEEIVYQGIAFAPDGGSLFYNVSGEALGGGTIFKMRVFGGVPEKIRENVGSYITFAPDGKQFAFIRQDRDNRKTSLIIYEIADGREREIASRPLNLAFYSTSAAWSPDGKQIAVAAVNDSSGDTTEAFTVAVDDGAVKPLTSLGWNGIRALVWTRDGDGLFCVAGEHEARWESQIWFISYPNGAARRIVSDLNVYGAVLGLSAAGDELLALQAQHSSNIWVAPADNLAAAKQITFELLGKRSGWDTLEWTADGRIAYTAFSDASEVVREMDADGKNQKQIIPENRTNTNFSFSADGRKLVFSSNRSGAWEIWTANGDGSDIRQLTSGGGNSQPHISPDGNSIVYRSTRGAEGAGALRRVPSAGGEPNLLTETDASWARFSPDGKFVACVYPVEGKPKLAVLNAENGQTTVAFSVPQSANFNNGMRWTPDGANLTYRDWNNGIWRQPLSGGEPKRLEGLPEEKLYSYGWSRDGKQFAFTRGTEIRDAVLIKNTK